MSHYFEWIKGGGIISDNPETAKQGHINMLKDDQSVKLVVTYRDQVKLIAVPRGEFDLTSPDLSVFGRVHTKEQLRVMRALVCIHHSHIVAFKDLRNPRRWILRDGSVLREGISTPINHIITDQNIIRELDLMAIAPLNLDDELDQLNLIEGLNY